MEIVPDRLMPAPEGAPSLTPAHVAAQLGEALHDSIADYLIQTAGAAQVRGGLFLHGAAAIPAVGLPIEGWQARFGGDFPALRLGSDGEGHAFWVHAGTGQVISVHHDSLEERIGTLPAKREAATQRVLSTCAALSIGQLVAVHAALEGIGDDAAGVLHAVCDALGWTIREAADRLDTAALMFLWVRARDLLEGGDTAGLQAVRDVLHALKTDPASLARKRTLVLSRAGLRTLPPGLARLGGLTRIDLSGNPGLRDVVGLAKLTKLRDVSLAGCRLSAVPASVLGLKALQKLDLSDNPLAALPDLSGLPKLKRLDLRGTRVDSPALVEPVRTALPGCVIFLARSPYPASISAAMADPAAARIIDLSVGYSDDDAQIDVLPSLARFPNLEILRLDNQSKLMVQDVLTAAKGCALKELDLRGVGCRDAPLTDLKHQPRLEIIRAPSVGYHNGDTRELLRYAAEHDSLRVLQCSAGYDWDGALPVTALEELHLGDLRPEDFSLTLNQPQLRRLTLDGYEYTLTDDLGLLTALQELSISSGLTNPGVISGCAGLTVLKMDRFEVERFPDLSGMTRLERLELEEIRGDGDGALTQLGALPTLHSVKMHRCSVTPKKLNGLWAAGGLRALDLSFENAVPLPPGLESMTGLRTLRLHQVVCTPKSLALPGLTHLLLSGDEGDGNGRLAVATAAARGLEDLDVHDFGLTRIPETLGGLTALKRLRLSVWDQLNMAAQPDVFGTLPAVGDLELSGMVMKRLPEGVLTMPLTTLTLNNAYQMDWRVVFRQLAAVPTLRVLKICWGKLVDVPAEIAGLTGLTELMIHQSGTRRVSPEIGALTRLQRLQITTAPWPAADRKAVRKRLPACQVVSW